MSKYDSAILYQSRCNDWMQALIFVNDVGFNFVSAVTAIRKAINAYWQEEFDCYGEAIENRLAAENIDFEIEYCKYDPSNDNPFEAWEDRIAELECMRVIKYYMD